jgi:hypothetical protein
LDTREIWSRGGMMSEIIDVPLLCGFHRATGAQVR